MKACLNGGRRVEEHPAVPVTAEQLASAAVDAVAAGGEALHLHPRDRLGVETLDAGDVGAAVTAVRRGCPGVSVGVSTGLWISEGDVRRRLAAVARWVDLPVAARPDFASVNVGEAGFADLVQTLHQVGVGVEAGVWSTADAQELAAFGAAGWTRILVEIIDSPAETAAATADVILARLDELGVAGPRLLHGEEAACWQLVAHAGRLGLPTRIGLEDTTIGPDGQPATDNAHLIRQALNLWTAAATSR
ncbi:hypothetical protein GCM10010124_25600 [Pilimelia terevasa]|uniref:3-keto-5-aminohexanoate cleavage protein n=1 Tax=Pilimelia terevasa TaxID=53372 RepID=A0A8J3BSB3_9ACTN|nr:3-keto-5-aminohexanoate cleavage protein [Pilimelia terevasa]GGK31710.1 hypothetical protein GCM10010124_25600 [Pilimelia terevasa]